VMELVVFCLIVVLPLAAIAARLAERRRRSFWVYFVFCAVFPVASLVAIPYLLARRGVA
jgi:hypothetical protein